MSDFTHSPSQKNKAASRHSQDNPIKTQKQSQYSTALELTSNICAQSEVLDQQTFVSESNHDDGKETTPSFSSLKQDDNSLAEPPLQRRGHKRGKSDDTVNIRVMRNRSFGSNSPQNRKPPVLLNRSVTSRKNAKNTNSVDSETLISETKEVEKIADLQQKSSFKIASKPSEEVVTDYNYNGLKKSNSTETELSFLNPETLKESCQSENRPTMNVDGKPVQQHDNKLSDNRFFPAVDNKPDKMADIKPIPPESTKTNLIADNKPIDTKMTVDNRDKKAILREKKNNYKEQKKRWSKEAKEIIRDPEIFLMQEYIRIRTTMKSWLLLYGVVKPGLMVIYKKNPQTSHRVRNWVGTVLLSSCKLIERPSKKDGFCFKIFHPHEQTIWAKNGPKGEAWGSLRGYSLPLIYLILRAHDRNNGHMWLEALNDAIKGSQLVNDTSFNKEQVDAKNQEIESISDDESEILMKPDEIENLHFQDISGERSEGSYSSQLQDSSEEDEEAKFTKDNMDPDSDAVSETRYILDEGEASFKQSRLRSSQTEEVASENKNIIWGLLKQVRPGMDLHKVVLPTFILEPRSFLEKMTDYYFHSDLIAETNNIKNPYLRMKQIIKFYFSGFYKKPVGVKKPYNSVLGETFRCCWEQRNGSRTFYVAEGVSHYPPISAFYLSNRQDGYSVTGTVIAKSKFYGNSVAAVFEGAAKLLLINRGEEYVITFPYALCKGIVWGSLNMELGGNVKVKCEQTGYQADITFKLKPLMGSSDTLNQISGSVKLGKKTIATLDGKWDQEIIWKEKQENFANKYGETSLLWKVDETTYANRLPFLVPPTSNMSALESRNLWKRVTSALKNGNQDEATKYKTDIEVDQRARIQALSNDIHKPRLFVHHTQKDGQAWYSYKHADDRPWDTKVDLYQYESSGGIIATKKARTSLKRFPSAPMRNTDQVIEDMDKQLLNHSLAESDSSVSDHQSRNIQFSNVLPVEECPLLNDEEIPKHESTHPEIHQTSTRENTFSSITLPGNSAQQLKHMAKMTRQMGHDLKILSDKLDQLTDDFSFRRQTDAVLLAIVFVLVLAIINLYRSSFS